MPTIDQLAPATAASDTDVLLSSQNGITRKVTRAQLIAGLQPEFSLSSGALLGRSSAGAGTAEQIAIGANLIVNAGTISAAAAAFVVGSLPAGTVPASTDLISLSQGGTNVAVTFGQLASGLAGLSGIDASAMTVSVAGKSQTLATLAANAVSAGGGTMTGPLTLSAVPTSPFQAAPKQYVDNEVATTLPLAGGTLTGPLNGAAASFSGTVSVGGALNCGGGLSLSGTLSATSQVQLGPTSIKGNLSVAGGLSATGNVSGNSLNITGLVTAGGPVSATGLIIAQGGATMAGGVLQLSQYAVASLPSSPAGALAYASNGRKPGESSGAGTGVIVWSSGGAQWLSMASGAPVQA